jgi:hypothetical protein
MRRAAASCAGHAGARAVESAIHATDPVDEQDDLRFVLLDIGYPSWIIERTMRFFSRASVVDAVQTT